MSRVRTDAVTVRPSNNVYTALAGAACVAVLLALILVYMAWSEVTGGEPLFFGLF